MSLSDEERRSLEELERGLAASDPDLDLQLKSGRLRGTAARTVMGVLGVLAGFALIIAGIATQILIVGVAGFLVAGAGAYVLLSRLVFRRRLRRDDGGDRNDQTGPKRLWPD
ncbi:MULTISPECIES: DUF3040 domain-containing protein [Paenarthrobacter]|uniref:DUF3040 domain-containing protein n=1 Tax=Paenarthrobacter TaxID=1742992 RepID=UPI00074D2E12|nr:DUF3040 domain-containing protein [Paenarthrobacter ureafaciens]AMB41712.1 hypothetical protein AUT26_17000 [Arthrobacter sp. ATCC 21022]RWW94390.1 DUF3040 domain-containing protein [Paenarthrobacter ureafaciens]